MSHRLRRSIVLLLLALVALGAPASAADSGALLHFKDRRFAPQTLTVPAGEPLSLTVVNDSGQAIEFESFKLNREKVVDPGGKITVRLPALSPGSYDFYDDFHDDVPQGTIVAR